MAVKSLFITIIFITNILTFETAITPGEKELGMMYRQDWGNIDGMLFFNEAPRRVSYWMKNTTIPMTMWYLDSNLNLLESYNPAVLSTDLVISSNTNIKYVLEIKPTLTNIILRDYPVFKKKLSEKVLKIKN